MDANFRFIKALSLNGFLAQSFTPGVVGGQVAGKGAIAWNANFAAHAVLAAQRSATTSADDIGFIKRQRHPEAFRRLRNPQTARMVAEVRRSANCIRTRATTSTPISRTRRCQHTNHVAMACVLRARRLSGAAVESAIRAHHDAVPDPRRSVVSRPGSYSWNEFAVELETDHSRKLSGSALITGGGFWSGTQRSAKVGVVYRPSYHLTFDTALQRNDISLPATDARLRRPT